MLSKRTDLVCRGIDQGDDGVRGDAKNVCGVTESWLTKIVRG